MGGELMGRNFGTGGDVEWGETVPQAVNFQRSSLGCWKPPTTQHEKRSKFNHPPRYPQLRRQVDNQPTSVDTPRLGFGRIQEQPLPLGIAWSGPLLDIEEVHDVPWVSQGGYMGCK